MRISTWLKILLTVALALVVLGVIFGRRALNSYRTERSINTAEKLIGQKKYKEAIAALQPITTPEAKCDKCVLLVMKAYLLSGDPQTANVAAAKYKIGRFDSSPLLDEVNALNRVAAQASALLTQVQEQAQSGRYSDAIQSLDQARKIFPYFEGYDDVLGRLQIADAFTRHDWDRYLELAAKQFDLHRNSSEYASSYAGALATKWAATGDTKYKMHAEEMLSKAQSLAVTAEERDTFAEYSERVRYRISSRQIIDKSEYDRRFRSGNGKHPSAQ